MKELLQVVMDVPSTKSERQRPIQYFYDAVCSASVAQQKNFAGAAMELELQEELKELVDRGSLVWTWSLGEDLWIEDHELSQRVMDKVEYVEKHVQRLVLTGNFDKI